MLTHRALEIEDIICYPEPQLQSEIIIILLARFLLLHYVSLQSNVPKNV